MNYLLTQRESEIEEMLNESNGEITPEIEAKISELDESKTAICIRLANILDENSMNQIALKNKIEKLNKMLKICKQAEINTRQRIIDFMNEVGQKKIGNDAVKLTVVTTKNNRLIVDDSLAIPKEYKHHTVVISDKDYEALGFYGVTAEKHTFSIDKNGLKQFLKENDEIGDVGAHLEDSVSLRIK